MRLNHHWVLSNARPDKRDRDWCSNKFDSEPPLKPAFIVGYGFSHQFIKAARETQVNALLTT
jgi:hypothetical protein